MGCSSCKNKDKVNNQNKDTKIDGDIGFIILNIFIRLLIFTIGLLATPIIIGFVWYMLFKIIMLNRGNVNLMPSMILLGKKLGMGKESSEDKYPDDYEDLNSDNPDDYEVNEKIDKIII